MIGSFAYNVGIATGWKSFAAFAKVAFNAIPGIGIFIGFVLGAFIGNLFGRKKPRVPTANAEVALQIPNAFCALGAVTGNTSGNLDLVRSMGHGGAGRAQRPDRDDHSR